MGWIRVDDHFDEHPKLARVGPLGWGVWLAGIAYSNRNLTDGFVPRGVALSLQCPEFAIDDLYYALAVADGRPLGVLSDQWAAEMMVSAGLWEPVKGGYQIHDYHDYQPSKREVTEARKQKADRQGRWRNGKRDAPVDASVDGGVDAPVDGGVDAPVDASQDALVSAVPNPNPRVKERAKALSRRAERAEDKSTEDDHKLCKLLAELAKQRNPKFQVRSKGRWLTDMRLLRERDHNQPAEIERALRWVFTNPGRDARFWADVIQSPGNLREHFPRVWAQMMAPPVVVNGSPVEDSASFLARRRAMAS